MLPRLSILLLLALPIYYVSLTLSCSTLPPSLRNCIRSSVLISTSHLASLNNRFSIQLLCTPCSAHPCLFQRRLALPSPAGLCTGILGLALELVSLNDEDDKTKWLIVFCWIYISVTAFDSCYYYYNTQAVDLSIKRY